MIFNSHWFENSRTAGFAVLEICGADENAPGFVPLKNTLLWGKIDGPVADFTLIQTFRYTKEENPKTIEALYRFPLPGDAAVRGMEIGFGDVSIRAVLKSRSEGEQDYKAAKKEGKAATLMTRESPDVLTLAVAGLIPDEDIVIRTDYVQMGLLEKTGFSFRVPLTTAPRYVRSDERYSRYAKGQPLAVFRDPGHRFSLLVTCGGNATITSPTHALTWSPEGPVTLSGGKVVPDRDCVLVWNPVLSESVPTCHVFTATDEGEHFLALVTPPQQAPVHYPRDVLILVDHSGSMAGAKREAANWAVERFIGQLTTADRFNLCLFESDSYWFSLHPVYASREYKESATRFLADKRSGGTELGVALEQALSQPRANGRVSRHVVIITDAEVTDEGRILRLIEKEVSHKHARRTSMLCIDAAPNSFLAQQIAERGGGIAKFLTSSPHEEDITSALDDILLFWDVPVAVGLSLAVNRDDILVDRRRVTKGPDGRCHIDLGDVPAGRSTWVVARAPPGPEPLAFELCNPDSETSPVTISTCPAVTALFGARLIAELEFLMHAGYPARQLELCLGGLGYDMDDPSPKTASKVYEENRMKDTMDCMRHLIVLESLKYQVLSAETAFVAVRSEPGRTVEEQVIVANALPHGWSDSIRYSVMKAVVMSTGSRQGADHVSGGSMLWGNANDPDIFLQPDSTMKMECRRVPAPAGSTGKEHRQADPRPSFLEWGEPVGSTKQKTCMSYTGTPVFKDRNAVLFDSSYVDPQGSVPAAMLLKKLEFSVKGKLPKPVKNIRLLLYIGDAAVPRIRIAIRDLLDHGGVRPLNIQWSSGELFHVVLEDPDGEWEKGGPEIEVTVR